MIRHCIVGLICYLMFTSAIASCVVQTTAFNFGYYDVFDIDPVENMSNIEVSCEPKSAFLLTFSTGNSNNYTARHLRYLTHQLTYNLYSNQGMTKVLGDGTANTVVFDGNNVKNRSFTIYGQIPAQQNVHLGAYSDHIIVNLYY